MGTGGAAAAVTAPLTEGDPRRVGPYTTLGRLGAGALGVLYAARSDDGSLVAVRALRPELLADETVRARLAADVAAARSVPGPYAAAVLGADLEGPAPWMASVLIVGVPLRQAVTEYGPLPEPALLTLAAGLAEGLAALHAAGVMHGDLRPGTVLLTAEGPRIVDFALAGAFEGAAEVGVAGFLAPEQATGRTVTPAADMFALGSTLFFAAMGRAPFGEGTPAEVKVRVAKSSPVLGKLPAALSELVRGCFQKDPNGRAQPAQVLEYVQRRAPIPLGSGWLPPALAADVRAVGAALGLDAGSDANATLVMGPGNAGGGFGQAGSFGAGAPSFGERPQQADVAAAFADASAAPSGIDAGFAAAPPGSQQPDSSFGAPPAPPQQPAPSRRNLLLALTGGAVVVVGGGAAVAAGIGGGSSGTTPAAAGEPAGGAAPSTAAPSTAASSAAGLGAPSSANGGQHPLPPTGPLPPPTGAPGSLQGPGATPFWILPAAAKLTGRLTSMAAGEGVLVLCGVAGVAGFDLGGNLKWGPVPAAGVPGSGNGAVAGGTAYLIIASGGDSDLLALDAQTGAEKWRAAMPPGSGSTVRVGGALGGMVFVVGALGPTPFLWAVSATDGKVVWQKSGAQFATLAVPSSGTQILTVGTPDASTPVTAIAVDIRTGDQAWAHQLGTSVDYSRPSLNKAAYAGDRYVVLGGAQDADTLVGGTTSSGQEAWTAKLPKLLVDAGSLGLVACSPDAKSVVALSTQGVYAAEAHSGKILWTSQGIDPLATASDSGAPQFADGNVYFPDQRGILWAVDLATGKTRWQYLAGPFEQGAQPVWIAVPGGVVIDDVGRPTMIAAKG